MNILAPQIRGPLAGALTTPPYSATVLTDTPYMYWRMEETSGTAAADTSGNSRPGIYTNSPTLGQTGQSARTGLAVSLDGTNDHVRADIGVVDPLSKWNISFECWIKAANLTGGKQCLMCNVQSSGQPGHFMYLTGSTITLQADENSANPNIMPQTATLPDTNWHHIVGTFSHPVNGPVTGKIYVDGVEQATGTVWGFVVGGYTPNRTGVGSAFKGTYQQPFNGLMDEAAFYNYVLSGTRIAAHYAAR